MLSLVPHASYFRSTMVFEHAQALFCSAVKVYITYYLELLLEISLNEECTPMMQADALW